MSLHAVPADNSPLSRASLHAWQWAYEKAERLGVKLVVCASHPPRRRRVAGPVAVFSAARPGAPIFMTFAELLRAASTLDVQAVELMRDVPQEVEQTIADLGFSKVLPRQVTGYWFGPHEELPPAQPAWEPTGALLPPLPHAKKQGYGGEWLVLVQVDGWWRPLSYGAVWTWSSTGGLARDETWLFVPKPARASEWRSKELRAKELSYYSQGSVVEAFGLAEQQLKEDAIFVTVGIRQHRSSWDGSPTH